MLLLVKRGSILAVGVILLLGSNNVFHFDAWNLVWPFAIIFAGVGLLFKNRENQSGDASAKTVEESKTKHRQ